MEMVENSFFAGSFCIFVGIDKSAASRVLNLYIFTPCILVNYGIKLKCICENRHNLTCD